MNCQTTPMFLIDTDEKLEHIKKVLPKEFQEFNNELKEEQGFIKDDINEFVLTMEELLINCNTCGQVRSIYHFNEKINDDENKCIDCKVIKAIQNDLKDLLRVLGRIIDRSEAVNETEFICYLLNNRQYLDILEEFAERDHPDTEKEIEKIAKATWQTYIMLKLQFQ